MLLIQTIRTRVLEEDCCLLVPTLCWELLYLLEFVLLCFLEDGAPGVPSGKVHVLGRHSGADSVLCWPLYGTLMPRQGHESKKRWREVIKVPCTLGDEWLGNAD